MSIKIASEVWEGSHHKSGNLLVLLALADHADAQGKAWPGIPLLARKARLSERHARRCLHQLITSGEVDILPDPAPSGGKWYQIRLDRLSPDNLSEWTSASDDVTRTSGNRDADDRAACTIYIEEPSIKSSEEPGSKVKVNHFNPQNPRQRKRSPRLDSIGLISSPKNGF